MNPDSAILHSTYPVMEHFLTLQGEGFFTGQSAYFIRLGGCDVGCTWCDVKDSWTENHPKMSIQELTDLVAKHPTNIVVITGGEPTMHDLAPLSDALKAIGKRVHIETSGVNHISGRPDWITLSPKKFKAPLPEVLPQAHELKIIIYHKSDFEWAEKYAQLCSDSCVLYLQPEWGKSEKMTPLILEYIHKNPKWHLSLQTHKYIHIP